jgi:excisionase family DNA binding protein
MSLEHAPVRGSAVKPLSVTVPTALAITGLGRTKFYALVAEGRIRITKVGARSLVNYSDLERLATGEAL